MSEWKQGISLNNFNQDFSCILFINNTSDWMKLHRWHLEMVWHVAEMELINENLSFLLSFFQKKKKDLLKKESIFSSFSMESQHLSDWWLTKLINLNSSPNDHSFQIHSFFGFTVMYGAQTLLHYVTYYHTAVSQVQQYSTLYCGWCWHYQNALLSPRVSRTSCPDVIQ